MVKIGDRVVCLMAGEAVSGGGVITGVVPGASPDGGDAVTLEGWGENWLWPAAWFVKALA